MSEGQLYSGGAERFNREERRSLQEQSTEFPETDFNTKLEQLRGGDAAEIARRYRFGEKVAAYLKDHPIEDLIRVECIKFLHENPEFQGYHPALVRAVAEEMVADKRAKEAFENTKH